MPTEYTAGLVNTDGDIDFNNTNNPWKLNAAHIVHDPDSFADINYVNDDGTVEFNPKRDASNIDLTIENKKTDTIIKVDKNTGKKIKFEGISEFNENVFIEKESDFSGTLIAKDISSQNLVVNDIRLNRTIFLEDLGSSDNFHFVGNLSISGSIEQSSGTIKASNQEITSARIENSQIFNCDIGYDFSNGEINRIRRTAYFNNIDLSGDISITNDLIINNNLFLKNIEKEDTNYTELDYLINEDGIFEIDYNTTFDKLEFNNNNDINLNHPYYLNKKIYTFINNSSQHNFAFNIKKSNYIEITTNPHENIIDYNDLSYVILKKIYTDTIPHTYYSVTFNITGNFESISVIVFTGDGLNAPIVEEFNEFFLFKHNINLLDKIFNIDNSFSIVDDSISIIDNSINNLSTNISTNDLIVNNTIKCIKDVSFEFNLFVDGDISCNSNLFVDGDISCNSNLFVDGDISCQGFRSTHIIDNNVNTSILSTTLTVGGDISLNSVTESTSSSSGALKVAGGVGIAKGLNVGRDASFNQDVEISNNLLVKGDLDVSGTLDITKATTLSSTLTVGGNVTFTSDRQSSSSSDGALVVEGGVGIAKGLNVGGDASFNQDVEISNNLLVLGDASFNQNVEISNNLLVLGDASFNQNVEISNNLLVLGDASFNQNVEISNNLLVKGDASFNYNVEISNNLLVLGDASFNQNVEISNNLLVKGDLDVSGRLDVTQATRLSSTLSVEGDISLNSMTESSSSSSGALKVAGGVGIARGLNVGGDVDISGTLDVGGLSIRDPDNKSHTCHIYTEMVPDGNNTQTETYIEPIGGDNFDRLNFNGYEKINFNMTQGNNPQENRVRGVHINSQVNISNDTDSYDKDEGALRVAGGVGIAKGLNVGEDMHAAGNMHAYGSVTTSDVFRGGQFRNGDLNIGGGPGTVISRPVLADANENGWRRYKGHIYIGDYSERSYEDNVYINGGRSWYQSKYQTTLTSALGSVYIIAGDVNSPRHIYLNDYNNHGNIYAGGSGVNDKVTVGSSGPSDDRLKFNETPFENAINKILQMNVKQYEKTSHIMTPEEESAFERGENGFANRIPGDEYEQFTHTPEIGVIAQELHTIVPSAVIVGSENKEWKIKFLPLTTIAIKGIQEQQTIISDLSNQILALNQENTLIKQENTLIKTALNELLTAAGKPNI